MRERLAENICLVSKEVLKVVFFCTLFYRRAALPSIANARVACGPQVVGGGCVIRIRMGALIVTRWLLHAKKS